MKKRKTVFATVVELLTDVERWCKGAFARDEEGRPVNSGDEDACCWCIAGACLAVYGPDEGIDRLDDIERVLREEGIHSDIAVWHDNRRRTHAEVLAIARKAGI